MLCHRRSTDPSDSWIHLSLHDSKISMLPKRYFILDGTQDPRLSVLPFKVSTITLRSLCPGDRLSCLTVFHLDGHTKNILLEIYYSYWYYFLVIFLASVSMCSDRWICPRVQHDKLHIWFLLLAAWCQKSMSAFFKVVYLYSGRYWCHLMQVFIIVKYL